MRLGRVLVGVLVSIVWMGMAPVGAAEGGAPQAAALAEARPASACPELFGGKRAHQNNERARRQDLDSVQPGAFSIDLTHYGDWDNPERIRFRGLKLIRTPARSGRGRVALVEVGPALGPVECEPGASARRSGCCHPPQYAQREPQPILVPQPHQDPTALAPGEPEVYPLGRRTRSALPA